MCASVVIIVYDTGAREYSDLGNWYMGNILSARALTVLKVRRDLVNNKFRYNTYFLMFFFCINVAHCHVDVLIPNMMFFYGSNNNKATNTYPITLGGNVGNLRFWVGQNPMMV